MTSTPGGSTTNDTLDTLDTLGDVEGEDYDLAPGAVVGGRYEVVKLLGRGGMGAVYEATHHAIGRRVALKLLHPEYGRNASVVQRFLQEARAVNAVRHRNVVEVIDFGIDDRRPWLVMELLEGEALADLVARDAPVSAAVALSIIDPVCRALSWAHLRGFVHRDVKPDNIFLAREPGTEGPVAKVLDFGIAKNLVDDQQKLTATGMIIGTPAYMAPEQITAGRNVTPAADQYAVAALTYEMLTGRLPVTADTYHGLVVAKVTSDPTPLHVYRRDLPRAFCDVVTRALARDPAERYIDLEAFRAALERGITDATAAAAQASSPTSELPSPSVSPRPSTPPPAPLVVLVEGATGVMPELDAEVFARASTQPPPSEPQTRPSGAGLSRETPVPVEALPRPVQSPSSRRGGAALFAGIAAGMLLAVAAVVAFRPRPPAAVEVATVRRTAVAGTAVLPRAETSTPLAVAPQLVAPAAPLVAPPPAVADAGVAPGGNQLADPGTRGPRVRRPPRVPPPPSVAGTPRLQFDRNNPL